MYFRKEYFFPQNFICFAMSFLLHHKKETFDLYAIFHPV